MDAPFQEISDILARIEERSKRLEMTDELIYLLRERSPDQMEMIVRLTKGEVRPGYEGVEIGVAEKLAVKALYMVTRVPEDEISSRRKSMGDIGLLAEEVIKEKKQMSLFSEPLTVSRVFDKLERIASIRGKASQDLKLKHIAELLHDSSPIEARYITRIVCEKMRLGIADMTIVDALSYLFTPGFEEARRKLLGMDELRSYMGSVKRIDTRTTEPLYHLMDILQHPKKENIPVKEASKALKVLTDLKNEVKKNREKLVRTYNIHPDLGYISRELASGGMGAIGSISVEPGVPLRAMLGERLSSMEDILEKMDGTAALEYKYDGLRVQAHIRSGKVDLFSRQLERITDQFPDVSEAILSCFEGEDAIVEGECVPIEAETGSLLPFQLISRRRGRKHDLLDTIKEVPVSLIVFDCLYLDGDDKTLRPYPERRESIRGAFRGMDEEIDIEKRVSLSRMSVVKDPEEGEKFFIDALADGCEGVMAKSLSDLSIYRAGSRGWLWIKYKRDYRSELSDTMDLVVLGAFHGTGRRKGKYGALLMGVYHPAEDVYRSFCKLGSGFTDEDLDRLVPIIEDMKGPDDNVWKKVDSRMKPDVRTIPKLVLEVLGAEITYSPMHTCSLGKFREDSGLALRFPRFTGRYRDDKGPTDSTTQSEIESLYRMQDKVITS